MITLKQAKKRFKNRTSDGTKVKITSIVNTPIFPIRGYTINSKGEIEVLSWTKEGHKWEDNSDLGDNLMLRKKKPKTVRMEDMKPLQIGRIVDSTEYKGNIVMRTASANKFEVINLSVFKPDHCWILYPTIKVEILPNAKIGVSLGE